MAAINAATKMHYSLLPDLAQGHNGRIEYYNSDIGTGYLSLYQPTRDYEPVFIHEWLAFDDDDENATIKRSNYETLRDTEEATDGVYFYSEINYHAVLITANGITQPAIRDVLETLRHTECLDPARHKELELNLISDYLDDASNLHYIAQWARLPEGYDLNRVRNAARATLSHDAYTFGAYYAHLDVSHIHEATFKAAYVQG